MEVNYWMAKMTLAFLEKFEEAGGSCGGLTQDWKELLDKQDALQERDE